MSVSRRFDSFLASLNLSENQKNDGKIKKENVISALNSHYWNSSSSTSNSQYVGSWAKLTRVRPPRDVDVLFELPSSVHTRFENRLGNRQSQLLQEVKGVLATKYPNTSIRGDGPVVIVPFVTFCVEVIPAFALSEGGHWVCMTDNGGRYKKADYKAEISSISVSNANTNNNTRHLIRMMKRWQHHCGVPLKSFFIELTAIDFLRTWGNQGKSSTYYDWMVRDYLAYLLAKQNSLVYAPGTYEAMHIGSAWASRAETALARAKKACIHESNCEWAEAGDEWQKIFGSDIPKYI